MLRIETPSSIPACTPVITSATLPLPVLYSGLALNVILLPITVAPMLASMTISMTVTSCGAPTSALTPSLVILVVAATMHRQSHLTGKPKLVANDAVASLQAGLYASTRGK